MKIKMGTNQSGMTVRAVRVWMMLILLASLLCSLTILPFGAKTVADAVDVPITYDYKIENSTGKTLKVTDKNGTAISGTGLYGKLPDAAAAIMTRNANARILLGNGTSTLNVTVDDHFSWGYVGANSVPIGYGILIPTEKSVTLLGNMEVVGADITTTLQKRLHTITTSGNDTRYATCIEVGTRGGANNTTAKVTLNCNIKMIAPQAVGPMTTGNPNDKTYQQSVVMNHDGSVTVTGGSYSTVVSDTVRNEITTAEGDKIKDTIDNLVIFMDYYLAGRKVVTYDITGGDYVTDASAFSFYTPAKISNITLTTSNGMSTALSLGGGTTTLSNAKITCTGAYKSNNSGISSVIYINNTFNKDLTFTAEKIALKVSDAAKFFPIGLRSVGKSTLKECKIETKKRPAVMQFDKSIEATDCTFISDNDGLQSAGNLNSQPTAGGITYGDWSLIENAYGTFCIATPFTDPAIYYTKFHGKTVVSNTSTATTAYGIASAKLKPVTKVITTAGVTKNWGNPTWAPTGVLWERLFPPEDAAAEDLIKWTLYTSAVAADQPFLQRVRACANIFMGDNVNIDSKAPNIYCTDLAGFKINVLTSYNANVDNKIVTLKFDEVAEGNVAISGSTNAQRYKLISSTHSLRVGTGTNKNNLVMFEGLTLNVFSASVKDGFIFATCGFLDERVSAYTVWIGTSVNADETLNNEKEMELGTPDELGQFIAKIKLESGDVGKRVIQLRYHSVEDKRAIATLLITILKTDIDGNLTGDIDFGELGEGDKLEYKKDDGSWGDFNGNTIPNDALINSEDQIELKYTPSGGDSVIFNADAAPREPDIAVGIDPLTGKIILANQSVTVITTTGFNYQLTDKNGNVISGCTWTDGKDGKVVFSGLSPDTEYVVVAHKKGTATTLPSKSVSAQVKTLTDDGWKALEDAKTAAKKVLDDLAITEKKKIDELDNLTQTEKDAAKKAIDDAVIAGKKDIESKNTVGEVDSEKTAVIKEFDKIVADAKVLPDAKAVANNAIDLAAENAKTEIDKMNGLSDIDKESFKAEVDNAAKTAKENITNSKNTDEVKAVGSDGTDAIDTIVVAATELAKAKTDAKKVLDDLATAEIGKIEALDNLSADEKTTAKNAIDKAFTDGKAEIDKSITVEAVGTQKTTAEEVIKKVTTDAKDLDAKNLSDAKTVAKDDLDKFATTEKGKIDALDNLTQTEKDTAKNAIDAAAKVANEKIDELTKTTDIATELSNGKTTITDITTAADVQDLANAKVAAKSEIDSLAATEKAKIDALGNLTDNEKQIAKDSIDAEVTKANDKIDELTKTSDVATELANGKNTIAGETAKAVAQDLANAKVAAKDDLDKLAITEKVEIEALGNLSDGEKTAANSAIEKAVADGKAEIDKSTTVGAVATQKTTAEDAIKKSTTDATALNEKKLSDAKTAAKDEIVSIVITEKEKIDALGNLTQTEKDTAKNAIDAAAKVANEKIDELTKTTDIATELAKGKTTITDITTAADAQDLAKAKDAAEKALDDLATAEKAKIDALGNLTAEEKQIAKNAIDTAAKVANDKIDELTKTSDVATELANGKNTIAGETAKAVAQDLANAKVAAKDDLDKLAITEKVEIEALGNLSADEKTAAKQAIDDAVADGKAEIDKSITVEAVDTQKTVAEDAIKKATTDAKDLDAKNLSDAKTVAKDEIVSIVITEKEKIDALGNLTDDEKLIAKDKVDAAAKVANDKIDALTKTTDIATELGNGKTTIADITTAADAQDLANAISAAEKEFDEFVKDYTASGKYAADYDDEEKAKIATAKQSGDELIGNATSIKDLQEKLTSAKDGIIAVAPKSPTVAIDYANEQLKVEPNKVYTVNDGTNDYVLTADSDGNIAISGKDSSGKDYDLIGKILVITKNAVDGVQAESKPQTVEVPVRAITPDPVIDYMDKIIDLGKPNTDFTVTVDGKKVVVTTDDNGEIVLRDEWIGKTVSFVENGIGENLLDSLPKEIIVQKYWTLTFSYNDGGATADRKFTVNDGQTAPIQAELTRKGYVFLGWFSDADCTVEWNFKYGKISGNTVIYAGWQAEHSGVNSVTVTFVAEGQPNETKTFDKNTTIKSQNPTAPTGKTFAGWYTDSAFQYQYDFANKVTENITIYAKFVANKIAVVMPDGKTVELSYGDKLDQPSDPTKDGYTFAGWYTDSGCFDALLFAGNKTKDGITQNITLYPKWVQETHTITGSITDEDGNPIANTEITIEIQPGGRTITTDANGKFVVTNVPGGNYRIVVKYEKGENTTVVTEAIRVSGEDVTLPNISIMGANLNSKVEIGTNAPDVVVSGLNDLFGSDKHVSAAEKEKAKVSGNKAELKFVVTDSGKSKLLSGYATDNKKQIASYLDFSLFKIMTVNGIESTSYLSNIDSILQVIIPLSADMQGKTNYIIYRIHNGEVQEIRLGLENANADDEYMELSADGKYLTVHTKNFSSYAIAFDENVTEQIPGEASNCFIHWIVFAWILAFLILITVFTILFKIKSLANLITWVAYVVGLFVLAFFVWGCAADITLWILGIVAAIIAAVTYLFAAKSKQ